MTAHLRSFVQAGAETVHKAEDAVEDAVKRLPRTLHLHQVSEWRRDNPAILTGWRRESETWKEVFDSLWFWHNETVNVWSHIIGAGGAFLVILTGWHLLSSQTPPPAFHPLEFFASHFGSPIPLPSAELPTVTLVDTAVFTLLYLGSALCFAASAFYHLTLCHCEDVVDLTRRADFLGIFLLGNANFIPTFHYGFYCESNLRNTYIAMMTISCAVGAYFVVLNERFQTVAFRGYRTATYIVVGCTALIPFFHAVQRYGWTETSARMAFNWMGWEIAGYVGGAVI
ncbi:hypothetical protein RQP46_001517 [Phenoliferia psychrophenolica]